LGTVCEALGVFFVVAGDTKLHKSATFE